MTLVHTTTQQKTMANWTFAEQFKNEIIEILLT